MAASCTCVAAPPGAQSYASETPSNHGFGTCALEASLCAGVCVVIALFPATLGHSAGIIDPRDMLELWQLGA